MFFHTRKNILEHRYIAQSVDQTRRSAVFALHLMDSVLCRDAQVFYPVGITVHLAGAYDVIATIERLVEFCRRFQVYRAFFIDFRDRFFRRGKPFFICIHQSKFAAVEEFISHKFLCYAQDETRACAQH